MHLKTAEGQLERLRGLVLRCVTGAGRSTPTAALGAALCIEPLHLTIAAAAAAAKGLLRVRKESGEYFQGIIPEALKSRGAFMMPRDKITKAFMFHRKYRISLADRYDWATGRELPANGETWYRWIQSGIGNRCRSLPSQRGEGLHLSTGAVRDGTAIRTGRDAKLRSLGESRGVKGHLHNGTDSKSAIEALKAYTTISRLV